MSPDLSPSDIVLPSEQRLREIETTLMFGRRTVRAVYAVALVVGGALYLRSVLHHAALLTPIDPDFEALMIGIGTFCGVLLAAVEWNGWQLGIGRVQGGIPHGPFAAICLLAMVVLNGIAGDFAATQLVEWQAFHGLAPHPVDTAFTVTRLERTRTRSWVEVQAVATGERASIVCSDATYRALRTGEPLLLPVDTGRGGVRRVTLPALRDLRRE